MAFSFSTEAFAVPITIEVYPTQLTSLNYQVYYNGKKYMKELDFYVSRITSRSSIHVKSFNSYLYLESIAYGDYKIDVECEDFSRTYTLTLDDEYHETSHKTKVLDLDQPSGELEIVFAPESEQYFPNGNKPKPDNPSQDGDSEDGSDDNSSVEDPSGDNNSGNDSNSGDSSGSGEDSSGNSSIIENIINGGFLPQTGSVVRTELIALFLALTGLVMCKGVNKNDKED